MRRYMFLSAGFGLALAVFAAAANYYFFGPSVLRIAVAQGADDHRLVAAIARVLSSAHEPVRMRVVPVNSTAASAAALQAGAADLAVVRSDVSLPSNGQTLVILHHNPALLIAAGEARIQSVADLKGKKLGIIEDLATGDDNGRLLDTILGQYDVPPEAVAREHVARGQVAAAVKARRVDALFLVGPASSESVVEAVSAAAQGPGGAVFIPIAEAKAIAQRAHGLEATELVRGAFGGDPPRPAAPVETIGVTTRLMARASLRDSVAASLTRLLFSDRIAIAQLSRLANQIEAPPTDKDAALPVHPGAAAYLDDEEQSFFDKYSDYIYIGAMLLSVAGSALAAVATRMNSASHNEFDLLLERLLEILKAARSSNELGELDRLEKDTDEILISGLASRKLHGIDGHGMAALALALDQAREAIRERRGVLIRAASSSVSPTRLALGE